MTDTRATALQIAHADGSADPAAVVERAKAYLPFLDADITNNAPPPAHTQKVAPPKPTRTHLIGKPRR